MIFHKKRLPYPLILIKIKLRRVARPNGTCVASERSDCSNMSVARATQWPKKTLLLFALTHEFLQQLIEGDELYPRVHKKVSPDESQGWTVVLIDQATRFIWDMHCGRKDRKMFQKAMRLLCQVAQFLAVCSRSKWSRHLTKSPFLALLATAGSNAAYKIISACSNAVS
jgi:hypothetical protein